jgi:hypothetical protein
VEPTVPELDAPDPAVDADPVALLGAPVVPVVAEVEPPAVDEVPVDGRIEFVVLSQHCPLIDVPDPVCAPANAVAPSSSTAAREIDFITGFLS